MYSNRGGDMPAADIIPEKFSFRFKQEMAPRTRIPSRQQAGAVADRGSHPGDPE
jgi:hypothetical protein